MSLYLLCLATAQTSFPRSRTVVFQHMHMVESVCSSVFVAINQSAVITLYLCQLSVVDQVSAVEQVVEVGLAANIDLLDSCRNFGC